MKQLPFCRDPCLVLLIEKWNSWKDLCFIYIDIFQKVSFEAMLKPEVRFLETQQYLFDRGCVLLKSVHLGICESWCWGNGETVTVYMFTLCCLTSFFISSTDCPSVVGSTWECVLWDVNKWPLIASHSCRNGLSSDPLRFPRANNRMYIHSSVSQYFLLSPDLLYNVLFFTLVWPSHFCLYDCKLISPCQYGLMWWHEDLVHIYCINPWYTVGVFIVYNNAFIIRFDCSHKHMLPIDAL